jgi:hypothetical protein
MTTQGILPAHFTVQYSTNIDLLLQQRGAMLRPYCMSGTHVGTGASPVNQFGSLEAKAPTARYAPISFDEPSAARRWVNPIDKEVAIPVDNYDLLRTIEDPKSALVEMAAFALGRAFDAEIIRAANATSVTGVAGAGTEAFSGTYQIADTFGGAAACGLNVAKMVEADRLFRVTDPNLPDREGKVLVIGPTQHANLLNEAQVTSSDFNRNGGVLNDGKVTKFMGFDIVVSNLLGTSGSDRVCLTWVKSGMHLGVWQDIMSRVTIREDLSSQPWQVYTRATFGATRLQQGKVVAILCAE